MSTHSKNVETCCFSKCVAKVAIIFSLDRYETLDFLFVDFLLDVTQCKLYAGEHSSVINLYENKKPEHVLRLSKNQLNMK